MAPRLKFTEVVDNYNPTTREVITYLKDFDSNFWADVFKNGEILKNMTNPRVFEKIPAYAGGALIKLMVNLYRDKEKGIWIVRSDYKKAQEQTAKNNIYNFHGRRGAKVMREQNIMRDAFRFAFDSHLWNEKVTGGGSHEKFFNRCFAGLARPGHNNIQYEKNSMDFIDRMGEVMEIVYAEMADEAGLGKSILKPNPKYDPGGWKKHDKVVAFTSRDKEQDEDEEQDEEHDEGKKRHQILNQENFPLQSLHLEKLQPKHFHQENP
ncbi:hypothetical protein BCON_0159g00200 [Botryotinia convoluta]|uniref:Uncharacterized protein n=1 Tax=Botryotinia convoluta TaxID=54673 RepID=A0A4Z1HWL5_9HELO|nr:hypothetical protein BCON_0159g00200 [Botryotinia convoluta]